VSCAFSQEALALYLEGDLEQPAAGAASAHLLVCVECRRYLDELQARQTLLKSLRRDTAGRDDCARIRRHVMAAINDGRVQIGWRLGLERAILRMVGRPVYAAAAALLVIASVSLLAHIRAAGPDAVQGAATFENGRTLIRPSSYRGWVALRRPAGPHAVGVTYVSPDAYHQYTVTGMYPEGTVLIWQSSDTPELLASVRDSSRFDGGWGFFDFTAREGKAPAKAEPLPDSSGCRTCHQRST